MNIDLSKDNTKLVDSERLEELIDEYVKKSTTPIKIGDTPKALRAGDLYPLSPL